MLQDTHKTITGTKKIDDPLTKLISVTNSPLSAFNSVNSYFANVGSSLARKILDQEYTITRSTYEVVSKRSW